MIRRTAIKQDLISFLLPAFVVYCAGLVVCSWDLTRHPEHLQRLSVHGAVGLALTVIGFAVCLVAAVTLRRSYSPTLVVKEDHKLTTHGLYRSVRHPFYLGLLMVSVGVPTFVSSLHGLLIVLAMIPLLLNRIRIEERMMIDEYGDAYLAYRRATRKLIPFIY